MAKFNEQPAVLQYFGKTAVNNNYCYNHLLINSIAATLGLQTDRKLSQGADDDHLEGQKETLILDSLWVISSRF